ncbi:MAG TPA: hypothetical protein PK760_05440, partial [Flavobacteriales bacterium]|nr:hypothetical protein [Flavobacteriales bacterium]
DRVSISNSASTNITGTQITLEAWIFPTAFQAGTFQGSIINKELGANAGYMLRCGGAGVLSFAFGNGTTFPEVTSPTGTLVLNTWQHVAGTYDGTTMRIYKDGVQVGSLANATSIAAAPTIPLQIGHWSQNDTRGFFGKIDDARVWNVAQDAGAIAANRSLELCGDEVGLAAYYRFNQGTAAGNNAAVTTATDQTANANTGTLTGFNLSGPTSNWVLGKTDLTPCVVCNAAPTAGSITGSASGCTTGTSPTLTLGGSSTGSGISRQWAYGPVGGPYTNLLGTALTQVTTAIPLGAWEVVVTVTCSGFGSTTTTPFAFTRFQTPSATASSNSPVCVGQPLNLTGSTDIGTTFAWTGPNAFTSAAQSPSVSASATSAMAGTYSFTASANGCTSAASNAVVVVNENPTVSISPSVVALCPNPPNNTATLTANGNATPSLAAVLSAINANSATLIASIPTPSGFTNGTTGNSIADGCNDMYDTGNLINTNLGAGLNYSNNAVISSAAMGSGGSYFTNVIGTNTCVTTSATVFYWAGDINGLTSLSITGNLGADGSGTQNTTSFTVTANGVTYTALVKRVFGATDPSVNQIFLIPQPNSATQSIGATTDDNLQTITGLSGVTRFYYMIFAGAAAVQYTDPQVTAIAQAFVNIIPSSTITYLWSPNGETTATATANSAGTYTVTATAPNGCTAQASRIVTAATPLTTAVITPASPAFCTNGSVTLTATPSDGAPPYTYQWFDPSNNPAGTSQAQAANLPGVWTVNITDNCGVALTGFASPTVVQNPLPTAIPSSNVACTGQALNFTGTSDIGTTFTWTGPNSFASALQNPTIASPTTAATGTYTFTAFSSNGCSSGPSTLVVTVNTTPGVSTPTGTPNPICTGGSPQLNVTAAIPGYVQGSGGATWIEISGSGTAIPGINVDDNEGSITFPT